MRRGLNSEASASLDEDLVVAFLEEQCSILRCHCLTSLAGADVQVSADGEVAVRNAFDGISI